MEELTFQIHWLERVVAYDFTFISCIEKESVKLPINLEVFISLVKVTSLEFGVGGGG